MGTRADAAFVTGDLPVPDRRIRRREIAVSLAVLIPMWAIALAVVRRGQVLWAALGAGVAMAIAAVILQRRHRVHPHVGHDVWLAVPVALAHLVVSYVAIPVATSIVPLIGRQAQDLVFDAVGGLPTWVVALIAGLVIAPMEELYWRGTVQPSLGRGRDPLWAVGITTAVFVGFHLPTLQLPLMGAALLGGVAWGWLRERTQGLAAPVLAHSIWTMAIVVVPPT